MTGATLDTGALIALESGSPRSRPPGGHERSRWYPCGRTVAEAAFAGL